MRLLFVHWRDTMIRRFIFSLCLVFVTCTIAHSEDFVVRSVKWGMSPEDVVTSEKTAKKVKADDNEIVFNDTVFKQASVISYRLNDNRLIGVTITVPFSHGSDLHNVLLLLEKRMKEKYKQIHSVLPGVFEYENNETFVIISTVHKSNAISIIYTDQNYRKQQKSLIEQHHEKIKQDVEKF